jgi:serine/threonine protein kinase
VKRCPYCAEKIQDEAVKCKHCGSILHSTGADTLDGHHTIQGSGPAAQYDTLDAAVTQGRDAMTLARQYRIVRKLGEGGMGVVYLAEDMEMGNRPVAVKVLPPLLARNPRAVENLRKEAMVAINLTHPNIIRLYGFHSDGELKFLVMEYIDGQTLEERILRSERHRLSIEEVLPIAEPVAAGLDYAHSRKPPVFHRDLKPSNVMIDKEGQVKLLDFGIAREMKDSYTSVTGKEDTAGTLLYMSPEQVRGKRPTAAMDIYSFGVVCYECLSGRPPFHTGELTYQILNEQPERLRGVSKLANDCLERALSKSPETRQRTATGMVAELSGRPASTLLAGVELNRQVASRKKKAPTTSKQVVRAAGIKSNSPSRTCTSKACRHPEVLNEIRVPKVLAESCSKAAGSAPRTASAALKATFCAMRDVAKNTRVTESKRVISFTVAGFGIFYVRVGAKGKTVVFRADSTRKRNSNALVREMEQHGISSADKILASMGEAITKCAAERGGITVGGFGNFAYRDKYGKVRLWLKRSRKFRDYLNGPLTVSAKPSATKERSNDNALLCSHCGRPISLSYYLCGTCGRAFHGGDCTKTSWFSGTRRCRSCNGKLTLISR